MKNASANTRLPLVAASLLLLISMLQPLLAANLVVEPDSLSMGPVRPGDQVQGEVRVSNSGDDEVEIAVAISGPGFHVEPRTLLLPAGEAKSVTATFRASETGEFSGELLFEIQGFLKKESLHVPLRVGVARGQLRVLPDPSEGLALGAADIGQTAQATVQVHNPGPVPVQLDTVFLSAGGQGFSVTVPAGLTLAPGEKTDIQLIFEPQSGGTFADKLVLVASQTHPSRVELPVNARALAPRIAVSPIPEVGLRFGDVELGQTRTRRLTVLNQGQAPLRLSAPEPSSGAYRVTFNPETQAQISPGNRVDVPITFRPRYEGRAEARILVSSNDPETPEVVMPATGTAAQSPPRIDILNDERINFGSVAVGEHGADQLLLWNRGGAPFTVTMDLRGEAPDDFELELPSVLLQPGDVRRISIRFLPRETGERRADLLVQTEAGTESLKLLGVGKFLELTPTTLEFDRVAVGKTGNVAAEIYNLGNADFTVTNVTSSDPDVFAVQCKVSASNKFVLSADGTRPLPISVVFSPPARGVYNGVVQVQGYWDRAFESREILLTGTGIAADIGLHPSGPFDFGYVVLGEQEAQTVVATNTGDTDLRVEAHPENEEAWIEPTEFELGPGESTKLRLVFSPVALGKRSTKVRLISNAIEEKTLPLQVAGQGALDNIDLERVVRVLVSRKSKFDTLEVAWNNTPVMLLDQSKIDVVFRIPDDVRDAMIGREFLIEWTRLDANYDEEGSTNKVKVEIQDAGETHVLAEKLNLRLLEDDNQRVRLKISTQNHPGAPLYSISQIFAAGGWKWEFEAKTMVSFFSIRPSREYTDSEGNPVEGQTERLIGLPAIAFFGFHNSEGNGISGIHLTAIGNLLEALSTENSIAVSMGVAVSLYKDRFMFGVGRDVYDHRPRAKRKGTSDYIMTFKYWGLSK